MGVDLVSARPDIVFLRRRLRVGETAAPVVAAAPRTSLNLSRTAPTANAAGSGGRLEAPTVETIQVAPEKPSAVGRVVLTPSAPVVRLNARQSALGSLRASGVSVFAWETADRLSGVELNPAGSTRSGLPSMIMGSGGNTPISRPANTAITRNQIPSFSNRKLVEFYQGEVILGLRHFKTLRRLVLGSNQGEITLNLLDGASIVIDTNSGENVAYISVINNIIEVRLETLSVEDNIASAFSIGN